MNVNRRDFLSAGAMAVGAAIAGKSANAAETCSGDAIKFCVFADIHYYPGMFPNDSIDFLQKVLDRAKTEHCDMVIELGDFCHNPLKCMDYVDRFNDCGIPTYHVLGNHENDVDSHEAVLKAYRMKEPYYYFDMKGFRFIALDTNYIRHANGSVEHYSAGSNMLRERKKHPGCVNNQMNPEQFDWLRDAIESSRFPCVICSHASLERTDGVDGADRVREIIDAANAKSPGKVRLAMNGHHHTNHLRIFGNVVYFDVNSASQQYYGKTHNAYSEAYFKSHAVAHHTIAWKDPLSAIVTMFPDGRLKVEGSHSEFLFGINPKKAGLGDVVEPGNRYVDPPKIEDVELKMYYS